MVLVVLVGIVALVRVVIHGPILSSYYRSVFLSSLTHKSNERIIEVPLWPRRYVLYMYV